MMITQTICHGVRTLLNAINGINELNDNDTKGCSRA
jgi:hypothetical protein